MIQGDRLSTTSLSAGFLSPDDRDREFTYIDYEQGGVGVTDTALGLDFQVWVAEAINGTSIIIYPELDPGNSTTVLTDTGITSISLAFDQVMRPTISYGSKLYWFDSVAADFVTTDFSTHTSAVLLMDDKRAIGTDLAGNDVLYIYIRAGNLYYRQQRDRYTIEYLLETPAQGTFIIRAGMMKNLRLGVQYGGPVGLRAV